MPALPSNDDTRRLAHPHPNVEAIDDLVARRLDPVRIAADLVATGNRLDGLERAGATTFAVVAVTFNAEANAVAIVDGATNTRRFVERFNREGVPSLWPVYAIVGLTVFGVDPEDVAGLADVERGRWYLPAADGSDRVIDPTRRRPARDADA
jgi:hypothetical protein